MYQIAICDDELHIRRDLIHFLSRYMQEENEEFKIHEFSSADELLMNYPTGIDLLLLDIYMGAIDGMKAAHRIRTFDQNVCLIFITNMYQRAIEGYAVRAFGFIRKPIKWGELKHELSCALKQIEKNKAQESYITLRSAGVTYRLPVSGIYYCEVKNHDLLVCTEDGTNTYRCSMRDIEEQLIPHGFLRCHASFLVNASYIRKVELMQLILKNGCVIPISQRRKKEFLTDLTNYIGGQI